MGLILGHFFHYWAVAIGVLVLLFILWWRILRRRHWLYLRAYLIRMANALRNRDVGCGRHTSIRIIRCMDCYHEFLERDAVHGYADDGTGEDVVAEDECPNCGSTQIDLPSIEIPRDIDKEAF